MHIDPKTCCPETCCFTDISAAQRCLGSNITMMNQEWCGYFATAQASLDCSNRQGDNYTGSMSCYPSTSSPSSASRASTFTWLAYLLTVACWLSIAAAAPQPHVKRDLSLGIYKGKDNFMYYNDGVRVNWTELHAAYARGSNGTQGDHVERINGSLQKRLITDRSYTRVGDGNPHQNYRFVQRSPTFNCADGECSVTQDYSVTTGWSTDVGGAWFASLGFSVSESHTDGSSFTCNTKAGGRVCVWYQADLTAYTAREQTCVGISLPCLNKPTIREVIMFAPNTQQCGITWHCRRDDECTWQDDEYYVKCGPPGVEDCKHRENEDGWGGHDYHQLPAGC